MIESVPPIKSATATMTAITGVFIATSLRCVVRRTSVLKRTDSTLAIRAMVPATLLSEEKARRIAANTE